MTAPSNQREQDIRRLLEEAQRLILHIEHGAPPEQTVVDEMKQLIARLKNSTTPQ